MTDTSALTPGTWPVDKSHTNVGFTARHLVVTKVRGHFEDFEGNITVGNTPAESSVEVTVDLNSVTTNDAKRDEHLKSADFFGTDDKPTMQFKSTSIKEDGGDYKMLGDLTINGKTNPVELEVEFNGVSGDPWGGTRAGFSAKGEINRTDWGINFNAALETGGVLVSEKVQIELEIQALKPAEVSA